VLNILGAEVNYGGRVTDDKDIRLIKSILERFMRRDALTVGFKYSDSGMYTTIEPGTQDEYIAYIQKLPLVPHPEAFGLHENAEITTNQSSTREILEDVLSVQPRTSSGGGMSREDVIADISQRLESKTPPKIDLDFVIEKFPTAYGESMNTVLTQEVIRYNALLVIMARMLADVQKALKGEIVMSEDLDGLATSLFNNQVPAAFGKVGFLSLKPLSSWVNDLNQRIDFIMNWINVSIPPAFWISGFFFPQAFFTGALQNYARKQKIAIDELDYEFKVYDEIDPQDVTEKPADGVFCFGMYFEGARWNKTIHMIDESKPKQLYTEIPLIWYVPKRNKVKLETGIYNCPVYKVLSRTGLLSTTGHSTNFVMYIELPTKEEENKWIRGGAAAFLALRY
jgi:dynein heavy chain